MARTIESCKECGAGRFGCRCPARVVVVGFGLGGHSMELMPKPGYGNCSLSGYETPERFVERVAAGDYDARPVGDPKGFSAGYVLEGAWLIDKREVVSRKGGVGIVLRCPLHDPTLQAGEVERCPEPSAMLAAGLDGAFKALLATRVVGGLDSVGTLDYVAYWKRAGARIGAWKDGAPVWEPLPEPVVTRQAEQLGLL